MKKTTKAIINNFMSTNSSRHKRNQLQNNVSCMLSFHKYEIQKLYIEEHKNIFNNKVSRKKRVSEHKGERK